MLIGTPSSRSTLGTGHVEVVPRPRWQSDLSECNPRHCAPRPSDTSTAAGVLRQRPGWVGAQCPGEAERDVADEGEPGARLREHNVVGGDCAAEEVKQSSMWPTARSFRRVRGVLVPLTPVRRRTSPIRPGQPAASRSARRGASAAAVGQRTGVGRHGRLAAVVAFTGALATKVVQLAPCDPESKGIVERANGYLETSFLPGGAERGRPRRPNPDRPTRRSELGNLPAGTEAARRCHTSRAALLLDHGRQSPLAHRPPPGTRSSATGTLGRIEISGRRRGTWCVRRLDQVDVVVID